jgi:hypothetical protein
MRDSPMNILQEKEEPGKWTKNIYNTRKLQIELELHGSRFLKTSKKKNSSKNYFENTII